MAAKNETSKNIKVIFNANVKYGEVLVKKGSQYEIPESDYENLLEAGLIESKGD